jgi:GTP-binding protein
LRLRWRRLDRAAEHRTRLLTADCRLLPPPRHRGLLTASEREDAPMRSTSATLYRSAHDASQLVRDDLPQIAFVGRSNVGKSSLINTLLRRPGLARTSSTPGRTRAVHYYLVDRSLYFVDLPGYGYAKAGWSDRESWARLVDDYLRDAGGRPARGAPAIRVVLLVDGKIAGSPLDAEAARYLERFGVGLIVAVTKIDRVPRSQRPRRLAAVASLLSLPRGVPQIPVSAQTGEGIPELWRELVAA